MSKEQIMQQNISDEALAELIGYTDGAPDWEIHAALTELQARRAAERWIPVSEKLPEIGEFVHIYQLSTDLAKWTGVNWVTQFNNTMNWTPEYWRPMHPLPPAPQEER